MVHGPQAGYRVRTTLSNSSNACHGLVLGYGWSYPSFSVVPRVGACRTSFDNEHLSAEVSELDVELRISHAWDLRRFTLEPAVAVGAAVFHQTFATRGDAPSRTTASGNVSAAVGLVVDLTGGFYLTTDVAAQTYFFRKLAADGKESFGPSFGVRTTLAVGKHL
jgi:hypothetical protein